MLLKVFLLILVLGYVHCEADDCPHPCQCKWKNGKEIVECIDRGLISIPSKIKPVTQILDLSGNNIQILPKETFKRLGLVNLQRIHLHSCRIGQIDETAFYGLANLIELDLSQNLLTSIPSGIFDDIPFLRELFMSNNPIQKVEPLAFQPLHSLTKLDLSNCEIQLLSSHSFEGLDMLEDLRLDGNRLSEFGQGNVQTLSTLSKFHGITLHRNPWHCNCQLRTLKMYIIKSNIAVDIDPDCVTGSERVVDKSFSQLSVDDFACKPDMLPMRRYIEARAGDNASITCRTNAVPAAHVNWYWNGKLLTNNSLFSNQQKIIIIEDGRQEKRSTLILPNIKDADSSEFYCVAENRAGNSEANFTLRVLPRPLSFSDLDDSQIAGLCAALVILIIVIVIIIFILIVKLRRSPHDEPEIKHPTPIEIVSVVNGNGILPNSKINEVSPSNIPEETSSFNEPTVKQDDTFCNPVQKPPRINDIPYSTNHYNGNGSITGQYIVSPTSINNPDLINDTNKLFDDEPLFSAQFEKFDRPSSGEYSRNIDSLYPSGLWEHGSNGSSNQFQYTDKTPIISDGNMSQGSMEDFQYRLMQQGTNLAFPSDYGLPQKPVVPNSANQVSLPANMKTLRVWQKGAVPVLPPVTALKRALNRGSFDEGYHDGCGTDV